MRKFLVFFLTITLMMFTVINIGHGFRGEEWKRWSHYQRLGYLLGFYDGIILMKHHPGFDEYIYWRLPYGELIKALDLFYSDYKNYNVEIGEALVTINMEMKGLPKEAIEEMKRLIQTT